VGRVTAVLEEIDPVNRNLKNRLSCDEGGAGGSGAGVGAGIGVSAEVAGTTGELTDEPGLLLLPGSGIVLPLVRRQPTSRVRPSVSLLSASSSISLFAMTSCRFDLATFSWTSSSAWAL
jgi:hypothetical protein